MEHCILTYYDDIAGINSKVTKMAKEVEEYVTDFMTEVQAEVDNIKQSKSLSKSKHQENTSEELDSYEAGAKHQDNKVSGKVNSYKRKSKLKGKKAPEKTNVDKVKLKHQEKKAAENSDTDEDLEKLELEEAFTKCFHYTESKPFIKQSEPEGAREDDANSISADKKILSHETSEEVSQKGHGDETEKASTSDDLISAKDENLPKNVKLSKPLADMLTVLKENASKKNLYAVKLMKGGMRSAKITIENERLLLHRLRKKHPPNGAYTVMHNDVMKLVDQSSRLTFLELVEDFCEVYGKMFIRLFGNTGAAEQFSYLCTGEKGPCYGDSRAVNVFSEKNEKLEYIRFGDYEYGDGTGGKPLVPELKAGCSEYVRPWVAGTLEGGWMWKEELSCQFDILMRDNPGRACQAAFGQVEEGLERLRKLIASNSGVAEFVCIRDCGIVLSG